MQFVLIGTRMWLCAAALRLLKHVVPMPRLVRLVRRSPRVRSARLANSVDAYLRRKGRFPFRPPGNCLERSLGAYRLLCEAGAKPELVVGMKRGNSGVDGHVWVTVDGHPIGDEPGLDEFRPIVTFDANARQRTAAGFDMALSSVRVR